MIKYIRPVIYDRFRCIASLCPDTCCQQWDIDVDPETYARYQVLPGPLGDKVRSHLHQGEEGPVITLDRGQCPMHRQDGLCELQATLGEQALCQVCRDFPRLRHDFGDFVELGLEMSCPEAARLLLTSPPGPAVTQLLPGDGQGDYDREAMEVLQATREQALDLLMDPAYSDGQALALLFFYGCHAQQLLDGQEAGDFDPEAALDTGLQMGRSSDFSQVIGFFLDLDILTQDWRQKLREAGRPMLSPVCRNLAAYLAGRYWLQAVSDYDLYCRVKFMVISCLLVSSLPGDFVDNAHIWSKEIENDWENMDAILDAAYESPVFTDDRLLGWLNPEGKEV